MHPAAAPGNNGHGMMGRSHSTMGSSMTTVVVPVPDKLAGLILGKAGRQLQQLQYMTGCRIQVSDRDDFVSGTRDRRFVITGPVEGVQFAQFTIMQKLQTARAVTMTEQQQALQSKQGNEEEGGGHLHHESPAPVSAPPPVAAEEEISGGSGMEGEESSLAPLNTDPTPSSSSMTTPLA